MTYVTFAANAASRWHGKQSSLLATQLGGLANIQAYDATENQEVTKRSGCVCRMVIAVAASA